MSDDVWMIELLPGNCLSKSRFRHILPFGKFDDFGGKNGARFFIFDFEDLSGSSRAQMLLYFELVRKHVLILYFFVKFKSIIKIHNYFFGLK